MANKRMIRRDVIDTDAFLDMPLSTQCLYFHLNLRADDDGFVGNPLRITKFIGASDDDLKLLIAKNFVILFEKGVIVIKHWRMHNTLSADRYHETNFVDEKAMLRLKENKSYTLGEGKKIDDSRLIEMSKRQKTNERRTKDEQKTNPDIDIDIDKDIDIDIYKEKIIKEKVDSDESKRTRSKKKEQKKAYGEFNNVLLTNEEFEKLQNLFSNHYQKYIEKLSGYIASKGTKYKSHYATIRNWLNRDGIIPPKETDQDGQRFENGFLLFNIDEGEQTPPFFGFPPEWFDEAKELIPEKVVPIKQRAIPERGRYEEVVYSKSELLEKYKLRGAYFENNSE